LSFQILAEQEMESSVSGGMWFKVFVIIVAILVIAFTIVNLVYFNRLWNGGTLSTSEASAALWLNAILLFLGIVILIWAIVSFLWNRSVSVEVVTYQPQPAAVGYQVVPQQMGQPIVYPPPAAAAPQAYPIRQVPAISATTAQF
jgi:lysylphosphatidylglycerol synthetase-like protein (DUF2156 family)